MPFLSEKIKIEKTKFDRRTKLSKEDKELLRKVRIEQGLSYVNLGRMFSCSKKLAYLICNPEAEKRNKELFRERQADGRYYSKEKHANYMKNHRRHKQNLLEDGEIKLPKHLYIRLSVKQGEYEHTHHCVTSTTCESVEYAATIYAARFWGYSKRLSYDKSCWEANNGEHLIKLESFKLLTNSQSNFLNSLLY